MVILLFFIVDIGPGLGGGAAQQRHSPENDLAKKSRPDDDRQNNPGQMLSPEKILRSLVLSLLSCLDLDMCLRILYC